MKTRPTIALALFLLAAAPLAAQKQAPPSPGKPKDFQLPARRDFTLDNGLAVTLVSYGTVPKVTVELGVRTGNIDEKPKEIWLADLTGDMLTQGTASRSATEIAEAAARMGGSLDVSVGEDRTNIGGDVLSEFGPEMVQLIADVVRHPAFPEKELARLKADRERRLSIARSQPQQLAAEKFREVLYGDHPYGHLFPTPEMLQGYTVDQVRAFYDANVGAARSHVYAVGRFDEKAMETAIRQAFGDWKRGSPAAVKPPQPKSERAVYEIDRPGAVQSTLNVGLPVIDPSHPDFVPLIVTNALLGGSFASRITSNIREQKGYTYSPSSQISVRYRDGFWVEIADVTTKDTGASLKEIFNEISRLAAEPPSETELRGIQNYLAGTFVLQNSSRPGIIGQLQFVDLHGLSADYLTGYVRRVYAVTPDQVQKMTAKYIRADRAAIVVVGDRKIVDEQLAPFRKASS
jgi:predicted Zn-dependent peptidase